MTAAQDTTDARPAVLEHLFDAAREALDAAEWYGWDWNQDVGVDAHGAPVYYDGPGERVEDWDAWEQARASELAAEHGQAVATEIAAAQRAYGESVQDDADEAEADRVAALECLACGDIDGALQRAESAANREREYGDAPVYDACVVALQALARVERIRAEAENQAGTDDVVDVDDRDLDWGYPDWGGESLVFVRLAEGWVADDGNASVEYPYASTRHEAAREYAEAFSAGESTRWVVIYTWRVAIGTLSDGREVYGTYLHDSSRIEIEPEQPGCVEGEEHDWQSPYEILGGSKENPGVWGHGAGVFIHEVCMRCGCERVTDTWAQDPDTGEQGLCSVRYEPGKYADEIPSREMRELNHLGCRELVAGAAYVLQTVRELVDSESGPSSRADVPRRARTVAEYLRRVYSDVPQGTERRALRLALHLAAEGARQLRAARDIVALAGLD